MRTAAECTPPHAAGPARLAGYELQVASCTPQDPLASLGVSLLSGAIAGVAAALVSQPADVLLSCMQ